MRNDVATLPANESIVETKKNTSSTFISWIRFIALLLLVFFIFRFAISITIINGNSMNPTLSDKDIILTSKLLFQPERFDIVVIHRNDGFDIIKRIIAVPNETVEIKNGVILVNGTPLKENYPMGISDDMPIMKVKEGFYFVVGDNRTPGESLDSRSKEIGLINEGQIKGEAFFSLYPFGIF